MVSDGPQQRGESESADEGRHAMRRHQLRQQRRQQIEQADPYRCIGPELPEKQHQERRPVQQRRQQTTWTGDW